MRYKVSITALAALFLSVTLVNGRAHELLRRHSLDTLNEKGNSEDVKDLLKNANKVTFVSITPDENNPEGILNAIKNSMPGVSHNLLDELGGILGGGQKEGAKTTTLTVTQPASASSPTPAKANAASGQGLAKTAASGQGLAKTAATNVATAVAKQTGGLFSNTNSSSLAPPNMASSPAATGAASNGVESSPSTGNKCACSCLCGMGPMPNGAMMNGASPAPASSEMMVNGSGSLLPNGECACSCICPPGSFPGAADMPAIMAPSSRTIPGVAGQTEPAKSISPASNPQEIQSQSPTSTQVAQIDTSPPSPTASQAAAQEPKPQQEENQGSTPQPTTAPQQQDAKTSLPEASIAQPSIAVSSGASAINLPIVAGVTTATPEAVPTPQTPEAPQNPNPINIESYKLSSSLLLGLSQPTPVP